MSTIATRANHQARSEIHYWLQLTRSPNQDFIQLLNYLTLKDLTKLDTAISDLSIRHLYLIQLKEYYSTHTIYIHGGGIDPISRQQRCFQICKQHLTWIQLRNLNTYIKCNTYRKCAFEGFSPFEYAFSKFN